MISGKSPGAHLPDKIRKMFKHPELLDLVKVIKISTGSFTQNQIAYSEWYNIRTEQYKYLKGLSLQESV